MVEPLARSSKIPSLPGPVLLVVMDGVGLGRGDEGDAVALADTPTLDWLTHHAAFRALRAHGTAVGLPSDDDMGNSEVGHNAMGAGRVYAQGATLVSKALASGSAFEAAVWKRIVSRCLEGGTLHLIGLLSDGNVHSHQDHLHRILRQASDEGMRRVRVHVLLDGRDVGETSALEYVDRLEAELESIRSAGDRDYRIGSGGGRMVTTMDRYEADWSIVERGWNAQVHGEGRQFATAREAVETYRAEQPGIIDQVLPPFVMAEDGKPVGVMHDGDAVLFFNFRGDRALEVSRAFEGGDEFDAFDRGRRPEVLYAGMTLYDGDARIPKLYLVPPPSIERTVSEFLAASGVRQFAISETQKFGHVTYFWNGNRTGRFDEQLETYDEVPSDRISFDEAPAMKAVEITDRVIEVLKSGEYPFVRLNFANGDMVGHTGKLKATVESLEAIDRCLARLLEATRNASGTLIVTADHGNADEMFELDDNGNPKRDGTGKPKTRTSHSLNPVGIWLYRAEGSQLELREDLPDAGLANLASTLVDLLGFEPPAEYLPSLLA